MTLAVALALFGAALGLVLLPLLRTDADGPEARNETLEDLLEQRLSVYMQIKELDFDHRLGKVSGEDYPAQREALRQRALAILQRAEVLENRAVNPLDDEVEREIQERLARQEPASGGPVAEALAAAAGGGPRACEGCGEPASGGRRRDRFCPGCGLPLSQGAPA